jgi:two-component system, chemotaxis family, protein-glutamate methylesterase/glutaminase
MPPVDLREPPTAKDPIRVLVVDDSAFMRLSISKFLSQNPLIQVAGTAHDGQEALDLIPILKPDVVTLDIEMPIMDGLTTLKEIMTRFPRPVVMLSSLTVEGATETIKALTLGAVDFIAKPDNRANIGEIMDEAAGKIVRAARARVSSTFRLANVPVGGDPMQSARTGSQLRRLQPEERLVVIGSSTGGPRALATVVPAIAAGLKAAVLIVQHMPVGFTRSLAERLDGLSAIRVKEAAVGDHLMVGQALLAPGGYHMVIDSAGQIALNQNQPVHGVRPAVDVTLNSAVQRFGKGVVSVILTGMGNDGTNGCVLTHSAGGRVIAEAESTCVVWGMPRSVYEAGVADEVVPLQEIASAIERAVSG